MKRQVSWGAFPFIRLHTHPAGTCLCAFLQTQGIWEWNTEQNLYRRKMCAPVCPNFIEFAVNFWTWETWTNGETCDLGSLPHHPSQSPIGDLAALQSRWSWQHWRRIMFQHVSNLLQSIPGWWDISWAVESASRRHLETCDWYRSGQVVLSVKKWITHKRHHKWSLNKTPYQQLCLV